MSDFEVKKSSFHPVSALDKKANYKRYFVIESDGSIRERVFLSILDPQRREHIICMHYMQNFIKLFIKKGVGLNILDRDNPWDFKLELSTGELFNIEITSIANNTAQFVKVKREERYAKITKKEKIPLHELKKISRLFSVPKDSDIFKVLEKHIRLGTAKNELIGNPLYDSGGAIFLSSTYKETNQLHSILEVSIQKKHDKNHPNKENTVLIIDNRTLHFQIEDFHKAIKKIEDLVLKSPFKEIWLYTGYYTEPNGLGGEFSLLPIKVTNDQNDVLLKLKEDSTKNQDGIIYT